MGKALIGLQARALAWRETLSNDTNTCPADRLEARDDRIIYYSFCLRSVSDLGLGTLGTCPGASTKGASTKVYIKKYT